MKKLLLSPILLLFFNPIFAQPQLDATVSFEHNPVNNNYRLQIVINQPITFKFSESYTSGQNSFVMIIKDLYPSNSGNHSSAGENTLTYASDNTNNSTGNSNGLGSFGFDYGLFSNTSGDSQIVFDIVPGSSFDTNDLVQINTGTIIQDPGNFSSIPTINPGPYTVYIVSADYSRIAAPATTETLSVNKKELNSLNIYPNPVSDILHFDSNADISKIEVYNTNGIRVLQKTQNFNTINVENLSAGLYFLKAHSDQGINIKKVLVK